MKDKLSHIVSRRRFLSLMGGAALTLAAGCAAAPPKPPAPIKKAARILTGDTSLDAQFLRQIIAADNRAARTVMWQSDEPQENAEVVWRIAGGDKDAEIFSAPAKSERYTDDGQNVFLHTAKLDNLTPGTTYEYRLIAGNEGSDWTPLAAENGGSFKALIFPDSQSSDYTDWTNLARDAFRRNPDAAFYTNLGDLVDNGEEHSQWDAWFDAVEPFAARIPFAPVMGNHETYDKKWEVRSPLAYLALFAPPENGSRDFLRYYYSFDFGDVHFMVLNTQWDETEELRPGLLEEQLAWLPKDAAASGKKWKVVLLHKDVLQYRIGKRPERKEGFSKFGQAFMPLFDDLGVDAVLSAHLHTYRNRGHIKDFQRDPAGPLYILTGVAGNVRYPGLWIDHALDETVAPQPETDNYLTLEASKDALRFQCFLPDGSVIDDVTLRK